MKNILILNGHPDKNSFCKALAESYYKGATGAGANVKLVNIVDLQFNPNLSFGYKQRIEIEADIAAIQSEISKADHLVLVYPNWWNTYPALLKGFFDRVFVPKFAFKYRENSLLWDKLLVGKSARMIVTMDTPRWYYSIFYGNSGFKAVKKGILEFCGIKPVRITSFSPIKTSTATDRQKWMALVEKLGKEMK